MTTACCPGAVSGSRPSGQRALFRGNYERASSKHRTLATRTSACEMPDYSLMKEELGADLDVEGSFGRFNPKLAVAIPMRVPGPEPYGTAERAVLEGVGEWILEGDTALGKARTVDGSTGRGAEGWAPVVEWTANAIGQGIIGLALAGAAAEVLRRLRRREPPTDRNFQPVNLYISRGMAAAVAADTVGSSFDERGPLVIEAVEEPSSIAGVAVFDLGYVGAEPWVVLLRNEESERRYYVIVAPDGEIMGAIQTSLLEFERMFLRPANESD
jgi:hypothetical protein